MQRLIQRQLSQFHHLNNSTDFSTEFNQFVTGAGVGLKLISPIVTDQYLAQWLLAGFTALRSDICTNQFNKLTMHYF